MKKVASNSSLIRREKLDGLALDIEFLLISVVQGVALGVLASIASGLIENFMPEYFLYIVSAFLLILTFWSQAIIHAISFIDWPLDLFHSFLYFLASLIEVIAFSQIVHPLRWFAFMSVFFVVALVLYIYDLNLISVHARKYLDSESGKRLYRHIVNRQKFELKLIVPFGLVGNLLAYLILKSNPEMHFFLAVFEVVFFTGVLINSIASFKGRSRLISEMV